MRLSALDLISYGPFSGVRLDLSSPQPGIHVVYGPNEAGKSTTLRAVRGLLFGIPVKTPDAHAHATKELRIGGSLVRSSGETISIVRRKGRKDTLLDADGRPLDEGALAPFLGGVTATLFEKAFGLDHLSLRSGAEAMLAGGGEVGESLFGASVGGQGVHRLLLELREEADALFTPLGRTRKLLVQSITDVKEQKRRVEELSMRPESYLVQKRALEEAVARRDRLREQHAELKAEQSRVLRILKVLSPLGLRASLQKQLDDLGRVPDLAPDASEARTAAERERDEALRDLARFDDVLAERRDRIAKLNPPRELLELDERAVRDIDARLGRHRAAEADLPKVTAKRDAADEDVRKALAVVRPGLAISEVHRLRPTAALVARIRLLANRMGRLGADLQHASRSLGEHDARIQVARARLEALPEPEDVSALERALHAAERAGDPEAQLAETDREVRRVRARLEQLTLRLDTAWTLETLRGVRPPDLETVERFERESSARDAQRARLAEQRESLRARGHEAERQLEELTRGGEVPTEEQLLERRGLRDELLEALRTATGLQRVMDAHAVDALCAGVREADAIADRLRREAGRAARHAALVAEMHAAGRALADLDADLLRLATEIEAAQEQWRAAWRGVPLAPRSPGEMRHWLNRFLEADRVLLAHDEAVLRQEESARALGATVDALRQVARAHGVAAEGGLGSWASAARQRLAASENAARDRRAAEEELHRLDLERAGAAAHLATAERERTAWQGEWAACLQEIDLAGETPPEEALALLDAIGELFARVDGADALRRRIEGMRRDTGDLATDVEALAGRFLPEAAALPVADGAQLLVRRHEQAHADARTRAALEAEVLQATSERAAAERRHREATARLARLCEAAGVQSPAELEAIERRVETARSLGRQLAEVEGDLIKAGGGSSIADLIEAARGVDQDAIRVHFNEIESELTDVFEEVTRAVQDVAERSRGFEDMGGSGAAAHALELSHRVSRLEGQTRRYLELRLAERLLDREIERFRRENQGPVLARASEIFPRLTRGRYTSLLVGFDGADRACLRCVRMDGTEIGVDALSDGTRDQLYLALRLATLERQSAHGEPMPLVLDDALVHFDDERAAAALAVLGEVAGSCQVLFFTHHARLVELAGLSVGADRLAIHRLPGA